VDYVEYLEDAKAKEIKKIALLNLS